MIHINDYCSSVVVSSATKAFCGARVKNFEEDTITGAPGGFELAQGCPICDEVVQNLLESSSLQNAEF